MDYELLRIRDELGRTAANKPKRGIAKVVFKHDGEERFYDLRGGVTTHRKFTNWLMREYGYLGYTVTFG